MLHDHGISTRPSAQLGSTTATMDTRQLWRNTSRILRHQSAAVRNPRVTFRHASTSTPASISQAVSSRTTGTKAAAKIDTVASKAKPEAPKAGNWPWKTVESDAATGRATEERIIYSRPPSFRPKMLWFVIGESVYQILLRDS
jgi:hypothetical protein